MKLKKISGHKSLQCFHCYLGPNDDTKKTFRNQLTFNIYQNDSNPIVKKMPCKELHTRRAATFSRSNPKVDLSLRTNIEPSKSQRFASEQCWMSWDHVEEETSAQQSSPSPVSRLNSIAFVRTLWQEWSNFVHKLLIVFHKKYFHCVKKNNLFFLDHS